MSKSVFRSSAVLIGKHKVRRLIFQHGEFIPRAIEHPLQKVVCVSSIQQARDNREGIVCAKPVLMLLLKSG